MTPTEIEEVLPLIKGIAARGIAVLMVEHTLYAVFSVSDRVIVLSQGRVIAQGTPRQVATDRKAIESYLGDELIESYLGDEVSYAQA